MCFLTVAKQCAIRGGPSQGEATAPTTTTTTRKQVRMVDSVLVLPRRCTGLQGDPAKFGMPPIHRIVSLQEALETTYTFDAHATMYHVPGCDEMPRINKSGYAYLRDAGQQVVCDFIMVDVDNPEHAHWQSNDEIEAAYRFVKSTAIGATAGFYASRRGYRLFYALPQRIDAIHVDSLIKQFLPRLALEGINADPACCDWTRLFRLPFATPEGDSAPLALPYDFEYGTLPWWPENLEASPTPLRLPGIGAEWGQEPPPVIPPLPEDLAALSGHPDLQKRVKNGRPIAEPGERYTAMVKAVGIVAHRLPNPQPHLIYRVLAYSVAVACTKGHGDRTIEQAMQDLWRACKNIAGLRLSEIENNKRITDKIIALANNRRNDSGSPPPPAGDGAETAQPGTAPADTFTLDNFREVVLFTSADAYYVLDEAASVEIVQFTYEGPFRATSLPAMLEKYAPRTMPAIRSEKGTLVSTNEILTRCGAEVKQIHAHIGRTGIHYDPVNRFIREGVAAIRVDLTPLFNPQIHEWLCIMAGNDADKFLDWLATFPLTDHPTCGLYLRSKGGTGKGMLAEGLARLWGTAPTMYANIVGTHNDGIAVCPLVWADEEIPASAFGKTPSAVFRSMVGNSVFGLRRMYQPAATLHGCLRLLVTANNDNALKIHEDLSDEDYQAIVDRIGYINVPAAAGEYLESLGGRATTTAWVAGDGIARHVLYLMATRPVKHGTRFLVKGWESTMHKHLKNTSGVASSVIEVVAFAISAKAGPFPLPGFYLGDGVVYASASGVFDAWDKAIGSNAKVPAKQRIVAAMRQLATTPESVRIVVDDGGMGPEAVSVWPLRAQEILNAMDAFQLGDPDSTRIAIDKPLRR